MNVIDAVTTRQSTRGFLPKPVSKELVQKILTAAVHAPSGENIQPWEITVLAGGVLDRIREETIALVDAGVPPDEDHLSFRWPEESIYRRRRVELGKELFRLMDIPRGDTEKRLAWTKRGFRFFDAPVGIVISVDEMLPMHNTFIDIGCLIQTICLVALEYGLSTCIQAQGVMYREPLRRHAGIGDEKRLVTAIALGYADEAVPANRLRSTRDPVDDVTVWLGFDTGDLR